MTASGIGQNTLAGQRYFWPALILLAFAAFLCRDDALNPDSLWYDDVWVALAGKAASPLDLFSYTRSTPIGFTFLVALCYKLLPDLEVSVQMPALLFSLALLPLGACLVRKITGNAWAGILAAVLLACSPTLAIYSVRVKQFTCDGFCSLFILWLALPVIENPRNLRAFARLAAVSAVLTLFSYVSFFVSFVTVNWLLFEHLRENRWNLRLAWPRAACSAGFCLFFYGMFKFLFSQQRNNGLLDSWERKVTFFPFASGFKAVWDYVRDGILGKAFYGTVEIVEKAPVLAALVVLGLILSGWWYLWATPPWRKLSAILMLVNLQALVLSALKLYPLGWGRVDLYLQVQHAAGIAIGIYFLCRRFQPRFFELPAAAFLLMAAFVWRSPGIGQKEVTYHPYQFNKEFLKKTKKALTDSSIVVINRDALYPAAYYTKWKLKIRPKALAKGIEITSLDPRIIVHEEPAGYRSHPEYLDPGLDKILAGDPARIVMLHEKETEDVSAHVADYWQQHGYRLEQEEAKPGVLLQVWVKESSPGAKPAPRALSNPAQRGSGKPDSDDQE
jgi:hypothetical protein